MNATSINAILVDDEPRGLNTLEKMLELTCPFVNITASCKSADEAIEKIKNLQPDLVFLDIAMPVKSGFDLLQELTDISFEIIFVTAHNQYMIEAFHFSAVDYLLKPINDSLLLASVLRAKKRIVEKASHKNIETLLHNVQQKKVPHNMRLCISSVKGFQIVDLKDILFCEALGNYSNFHFTNKQLACTSRAMHEYEVLLEDAGFVRIHKSYLVNLLHIKEYIRGEGGSVILSNGKEVEVSRRKKDLLMTKMKEYYKF